MANYIGNRRIRILSEMSKPYFITFSSYFKGMNSQILETQYQTKYEKKYVNSDIFQGFNSHFRSKKLSVQFSLNENNKGYFTK